MHERTTVRDNRPEPFLAVITVCRNDLDALKITVDSIQNQTEKNIIHIVVDGASSDGSVQWLISNKHQFYSLISEPDIGIYDAMEKGISVDHNAKWVIFLNAGDIFYTTNTVSSMLNELRREGVDFYFGGVEIRHSDGVSHSKKYYPRKLSVTEMPGCHQSCFVRTSVIKKLRFDLNYKVAADYELWLRASKVHRCKTCVLNCIISSIAPEGYSANNEPILQVEYFRAIRTFLSMRLALIWITKRRIRNLFLSLVVLMTRREQ